MRLHLVKLLVAAILVSGISLGGAPAPIAAQAVPLPSEGPLIAVDDLTLQSTSGQWPPQVGDQLVAHIRVRNDSAETQHVEYIGVRGRRNLTEYWDIGFWTTDLVSGQEWLLDPNNERAVLPGDYSFRISYSLDGVEWYEIGNEINFAVDECMTDAEYSALVALYNSTGGPSWTHSWQLPTDSPCRLSGVTCADGHLTELRLDENGLDGPMPDELGTLSELEILDLSYNNLTGQIPASLADLGRIEELWLQANALSGPIPANLGRLSHLRRLWLDGNDLTGSIPLELGNLQQLTDLNLAENELYGVIPAVLGQLSELESLALEHNSLTGSIPPELGELAKLRRLFLGGNQLSGQLPAELGRLAALENLLVNDNPLSGPLPRSLMNLNLIVFFLDDTGLCEPPDDAFQAWLDGRIMDRRGALCEPTAPKKWLLMYYLAGDSDLDEPSAPGRDTPVQYMLEELTKREAASVVFDIAIAYDGKETGDSRYYYIGDNKTWVAKGELDMSDPSTLVDFVASSRAMFPAEHEALTVWDHGSLTELLQDCGGIDCALTDNMDLTGLSSALAAISSDGGSVDVFVNHTCLSGSIESAYQIQGHADYLVASEEFIYLANPPCYLDKITQDTAPETLAREIANSYAQYRSNPAIFRESGPWPYTISVARLDRLPDLTAKVSTLADLLRTSMSSLGDTLLRSLVVSSVQRFDYDGSGRLTLLDEAFDLYDFCSLIYAGTSDADIKAAALSVMEAIEDPVDRSAGYIVINRAGSGIHPDPKEDSYIDLNDSHGVSIFFVRPENRRSFYAGGTLAFAVGTDWALGPESGVIAQADDAIQWGPMLVEYVSELYPDAPDDSTPPPLQVGYSDIPKKLYYVPVLR